MYVPNVYIYLSIHLFIPSILLGPWRGSFSGSMLDVCWMLDAGLLDAGCWMLDAGFVRPSGYR
ncbi:hypothetical protein M430DRAFT_149706 [Amorphotheca resinae ATCC 22711]|jgi:hypothetical protein|uniref:Uncharacterized protein n=1 Tax=Amorphotheca resinae ATCC 22711 TaxID=857342 RepID=A0A2T3BCP5_AMORE|nr:hypothetical protein M430DRAFT_149706 [Amorphotheca resinae ATCC 22711]PSS27098.1 hypothetical protein M430DRAFT_149706 [Amorphotheca resinae ATCC 22711]